MIYPLQIHNANIQCKYTIDSVNIKTKDDTAMCFYSKKCNHDKENRNGILYLIKKADKWQVDYIWKRDKDI